MAVQKRTHAAGARAAKPRRGGLRRAMFVFAFLLLAVTLAVVVPYAGILPVSAQGRTEEASPLTALAAQEETAQDLPVIAIDPGHGGTDPGSEGSGIEEYEMTWRTANALAALLEADGRFAPVLTITEEESQNADTPRVEPAVRAQRANDAGAVLLFSIHGNSDSTCTASGFECYPIPPGRANHEASLALARLAAQGFGAAGASLRGLDGVRYIYFDTYDNRVVYESSDEAAHSDPTFRLLEDAACPAVLAEQCFLTDASDAQNFASPSGCQTAAQIYYEAICTWWEQQNTEQAEG